MVSLKSGGQSHVDTDRRRPVRVLMAEASNDSLLMVNRELRSAGFEPVVVTVAVPDPFLEELLSKTWDLIIWEYPAGNGQRKTLDVYSESGSDIPILVLLDGISEEGRSTLLSTGVHGLLDKHNISRLAAMVAFELREKDVRTLRRRSDARLAESESRFQILADTAPVILWSTDSHGIRNYMNRQWIDYTARRFEPAEPENWRERIHPDDRKGQEHVWDEAFYARQPYQAEFRLQRYDGVYHWFMSRGVPRYNSDGSFAGYVGTSTDFNTVRDAENALRRHNERLQRLAFIASHDMREPLRTVSIYTQLLEKRYSHQLDAPAREFMGYVTAGVERIGKLMDDLLLYGEANLGDQFRQRISLELPRDTALALLGDVLKQAKAHVLCGPLPEVFADPRHMVLLFQNLIANAVKFRGDQSLQIKIHSERRNNQWVIEISDNGIGIAEEYRERAFGLFKRLHGPQYPGTGLGLALCQSIVENHGGLIWVTGNETGGSTFRFTLADEH